MPGKTRHWDMIVTTRAKFCCHQIYNDPVQKIDKQEIKLKK